MSRPVVTRPRRCARRASAITFTPIRNTSSSRGLQMSTPPAALVMLRIAIAVALSSGAVAGPAVEVYAEALAGLQVPVKADEARRAAIVVAGQLDEDLAVLAARAIEEDLGWRSDAAGRALSIRRTVATRVELERVERENEPAWAVLLAVPTTSKIVAMTRAVAPNTATTAA